MDFFRTVTCERDPAFHPTVIPSKQTTTGTPNLCPCRSSGYASKRKLPLLFLNRNPFILGKFIDDKRNAEAADAGVAHAAEWGIRQVVYRLVINMSHPCFQSDRILPALFHIASKDRRA